MVSGDARVRPEVLAGEAVPELGVLGLLDRAPDPAGRRRLVKVEDAGLVEPGKHQADGRFQIRCLEPARAVGARCLAAVLERGAKGPRFVNRHLVRALDAFGGRKPHEPRRLISKWRERHEAVQWRGRSVTPEVELFLGRDPEIDPDAAVREPGGGPEEVRKAGLLAGRECKRRETLRQLGDDREARGWRRWQERGPDLIGRRLREYPALDIRVGIMSNRPQ